MPASLRSFTDAAADAVARAIASVQRDAQRDRELREAEHRARLAELDARIASAADIERRLHERLAALRDGEPGADGRDGVDGIDGHDGAPGADGEAGPEGPAGADGQDGAPGRDGLNGVDGSDGVDGKDGRDGRDGVDGAPGKDGERGSEGPAGKLPIVSEWKDEVHYEGDVVTFEGRSWQALKDTGKTPGGTDWRCIVERGQDGRTFSIRGTWAEGVEYKALDVVALNGASFAACHDNPGRCPGDGWQLIAAQGKRGNPGERGIAGKNGERGPAGLAIIAIDVDADGLLTLTNGDGSTVECDLYDVLSRIAK